MWARGTHCWCPHHLRGRSTIATRSNTRTRHWWTRSSECRMWGSCCRHLGLCWGAKGRGRRRIRSSCSQLRRSRLHLAGNWWTRRSHTTHHTWLLLPLLLLLRRLLLLGHAWRSHSKLLLLRLLLDRCNRGRGYHPTSRPRCSIPTSRSRSREAWSWPGAGWCRSSAIHRSCQCL